MECLFQCGDSSGSLSCSCLAALASAQPSAAEFSPFRLWGQLPSSWAGARTEKQVQVCVRRLSKRTDLPTSTCETMHVSFTIA